MAETLLEPVTELEVKRLNINLALNVYKEVETLSKATRQSFTELVRIGLGLVKIAYQAKTENLKLAVIDKEGKPMREIVIP